MAKVIVFRGKAGVGKTTISNAVAQKLRIPVIRKDDVYDPFAAYVESHEIKNRACYDVLYRIVETNLSNGLNVIVDAGFHSMEDIMRFRNWTISKDAIFISFLCICSDEDIWAERFNRRSQDPKPNNLITDFNDLKLHYGDLKTDALADETILDSIDNIDTLVDKAIFRLCLYTKGIICGH